MRVLRGGQIARGGTEMAQGLGRRAQHSPLHGLGDGHHLPQPGGLPLAAPDHEAAQRGDDADHHGGADHGADPLRLGGQEQPADSRRHHRRTDDHRRPEPERDDGGHRDQHRGDVRGGRGAQLQHHHQDAQDECGAQHRRLGTPARRGRLLPVPPVTVRHGRSSHRARHASATPPLPVLT